MGLKLRKPDDEDRHTGDSRKWQPVVMVVVIFCMADLAAFAIGSHWLATVFPIPRWLDVLSVVAYACMLVLWRVKAKGRTLRR